MHNFVYVPQNGALTTWLVARDIHHATSVCRRFFWSQLNLWPDQLPDQTLVVLSGKDALVPVDSTIKMLKAERPDVEVLLHDNHSHADFIKDLPWQDLVVRKVVGIVEAASAAAAATDPKTVPRGLNVVSAVAPYSKSSDRSGLCEPMSTMAKRRHGRSDSAYRWEAEQRQQQQIQNGLVRETVV